MKDRKEDKDRAKEPPVTYEMYAAMPDDGNRYEIFDGVLEKMPQETYTVHQGVLGALHMETRNCSTDHIIIAGPLDVLLSPTNVLQPDLSFVRRDRKDIVTMRGIEGSPDLVVEVLAPGSRRRDKVLKLPIYANHGVPEHWIIDPWADTLERYVLSEGSYTLEDVFEAEDTVRSDKLPCVSFKVSALFQDPVTQRLLTGG